MTKRSVAAAFFFALFGVFAPLQSFADAAAPTIVRAHPALWRVHGEHGTIYLFGSIYLLPPNVDWMTPDVTHAMKRADAFVFEVPLDAGTTNRIAALVKERGTLPPGQSLRKMLPPDSLADLDKALVSVRLPEAAVDTKRPWLISLMLDARLLNKRMQRFGLGPDSVIAALAKKSGKETRYLETVDDQIALIAPSDPAVELQSLEAELRSFDTEEGELAAITDAWERGDATALDTITGRELQDNPRVRTVFFVDRNRKWVKQIEAMLEENKTFFVTVGVGHLVGKDSVPALLRAAGYKVNGP